VIGEEAEVEVMKELSPTEAPMDDPLMDLIGETLRRRDPGYVGLPNLLTSFTDATHWKMLGMKCYGFAPLKLPATLNFKALFHGHDERIPLDGFRFGLETLFEVVEKLIM
jgi:acetylornithine deacetylase/succinyl-diaminopimelate desuccinylase-like protein